MDFSVVSSDDVLASYRQQLSDAHHQIAMLEAKLAKVMKFLNEQPRQAVSSPQLFAETAQSAIGES